MPAVQRFLLTYLSIGFPRHSLRHGASEAGSLGVTSLCFAMCRRRAKPDRRRA